MISAPSPRQRLNGNSLYQALLFLGVSFLFSCDILKPGISDSGTVLEQSETSEEPIEKLDTVYLPPLASDTIDEVDLITAEHPQIKIAVMLPFSLDKRSMEKLRDRDKNKRNLPLISLEMYEGMLLAVDSLRAKGVNLDLFVYDTQNNPDVVRGLLNKPEIQDVNLIIGPLFNNNIKLVADFVRTKNAFMMSPLSPMEQLVNHPRFIMANNGPTRQCERLAAHIKASYPGKKVIVVHQEADQKLVNLFQQYALKEKLEVDAMVTDFKFQGIDQKLSIVDPNIILVPSFNEIFVNAAASKMSSLADSIELHTYGMNDWQRYESISFDYLSNIDFHFVTDYWVDAKSDFSRRFEMVHDGRFAAPPSQFSYKGYDLLYYFAMLLDQYPNEPSEAMEQQQEFSGLNNPYIFLPGGDDPDSPSYYSNGLIHIIRYADNRQEKVN